MHEKIIITENDVINTYSRKQKVIDYKRVMKTREEWKTEMDNKFVLMKKLRKQGLLQREVAEILGVNGDTIYYWEKIGKRKTYLGHKKIAKMLNLNPVLVYGWCNGSTPRLYGEDLSCVV